jgi:HEAT repeat protein
LLCDDDAAVRRSAASALGFQANNVAEVVPALIKLLNDPDENVRQAAEQALGQFGPTAGSAVPALTSAMKRAHGWHRVRAADALCRIDQSNKEAIAVLIDGLWEPEITVRHEAIRVLGRLGPKARAAVPGLTELLESGESSSRFEAAVALSQIGVDDKQLPPFFLAVIRDPLHNGRSRALEALARIHAPADPVLSAVLPVLEEESPLRIAAIEVLASLGPSGKRALPALVQLLKSSDSTTRVQAGLALWKVEGQADKVVPLLIAALRNPFARPDGVVVSSPQRVGSTVAPGYRTLSAQAADALGEIGPEARAAVSALTEVLKDPQFASWRDHYVTALQKIDPKAAAAATLP